MSLSLLDQVVSLKLAKKLKKLGYPQEGLFVWVDWPESYKTAHDNLPMVWSMAQYEDYAGPLTRLLCVAPTVAELGEILAEESLGNRFNSYFLEYSAIDVFEISLEQIIDPYGRDDEQKYIHSVVESKEADARAKMLIWLVENKYVGFPKK